MHISSIITLLPAISLVAATNLFSPQLPLITKEKQVANVENGRILDLRLRHVFVHGTSSSKYPRLHRRKDIGNEAQVFEQEQEVEYDAENEADVETPATDLWVKSKTTSIHRLTNRDPQYVESLMEFGQETGYTPELDASEWTSDEVWGPNVTDQQTVLSLARIAANAYVVKNDSSEWQDVGPGFNYTDDFGWEQDGLRGHIFADTANKTVVIGIKGTSLSLFDGSGSTRRDRENDNLLFSCCCGQGENALYHQVCDCMTKTYTCNSTCLTKSLRQKTFYYHAASDIYKNVSAMYPKSDIWLVGHSLGGSISSLVAATYGLPSVTFQAPGEAMAAARLKLPTPPNYHIGESGGPKEPFRGAYHFGHTADPIFMGQCNGSPCSLWGYAMQSKCHTGMECVYDTMHDFGWGSHLLNHRITTVIKSVILEYKQPAKCEEVEDCVDCINWKFFESNGTEKTTTSKASHTSTSTCKTPGWFGCNDETTTVTSSTTTSPIRTPSTIITPTTTMATRTCETPGWFGCNDETTTSTSQQKKTPAPTETSAKSTSSSASYCETPGWFGCNDNTEMTTASATPRKNVVATASITKAPRMRLT